MTDSTSIGRGTHNNKLRGNKMVNFATATIESNLCRMNAALKTHSRPSLVKEMVFNRVRVLKWDGYAEDVAFAKALKEHNLC